MLNKELGNFELFCFEIMPIFKCLYTQRKFSTTFQRQVVAIFIFILNSRDILESHKYKIYIHFISGFKYLVSICLKMASKSEKCCTH